MVTVTNLEEGGYKWFWRSRLSKTHFCFV